MKSSSLIFVVLVTLTDNLIGIQAGPPKGRDGSDSRTQVPYQPCRCCSRLAYCGPPGPSGYDLCGCRPGERGPQGPSAGGSDPCGCRPGERGPPGEPGWSGNSGPPGSQGNRGIPGSTGHPGLPGQKGERGYDGQPAQDGEPGPAGPAGPQGSIGHPGHVGAPGIPGQAGQPGENGDPGRDGIPGPAGQQGTPGPPDRVGSSGGGGVTYTYWGKNNCSSDSETLYTGWAGGNRAGNHGGGSNLICATDKPAYHPESTAEDRNTAKLFSAEYKTESRIQRITDRIGRNANIPCAVCYVPVRSVQIMIPGTYRCPSGWTTEYDGWLMAPHNAHNSQATFTCIAKWPDAISNSTSVHQGIWLYHVEADCASGIKCGGDNYDGQKELSCVVCTK